MSGRHLICVALLLPACAGSKPPSSAQAEGAGVDSSGGEDPPSGDPPDRPELAQILAAHNEHRKKHCAPPLAWSKELAETAQGWADELAKRGCAFEHSKAPHGENLAAGTEGSMGPERAARIWYDEKEQHDFRSGGFSMRAGHFTQLVWVGTERLGCGTSRCKGKQIWVCNYDPPGNMQGQFRTNVLPAGCKQK